MKKGLFLVCVRSYLNGPLDPVRADPKDPRDPLAEIRMLTFPLGGGENCQKRCEIIFEWPLMIIVQYSVSDMQDLSPDSSNNHNG